MATQHVRHLVGLSLLPGIGPARLTRLVQRLGSTQAAWNASTEHLRACGIDEKSLAPLLATRQHVDLDKEMERIERNGVRVLTPSDESYPELLREVYDRPAILYVKGDFKPVDVQTLAIVGTRRPNHVRQRADNAYNSHTGAARTHYR